MGVKTLGIAPKIRLLHISCTYLGLDIIQSSPLTLTLYPRERGQVVAIVPTLSPCHLESSFWDGWTVCNKIPPFLAFPPTARI